MSAAAGTAASAAAEAAAAAAVAVLTAAAHVSTARGMTRKDVTCDYCNKLISECMCVTAPTHSRYCDTCGRARPYCICSDPTVCKDCERTTADCACAPLCRKCGQASDKCVCPCPTCKYPGDKCRCYEGYEEPHPDTLCCARCYSDPCECEANARQQDLNREVDYDCPSCGDHYKYCRCGKKRAYNSDDD